MFLVKFHQDKINGIFHIIMYKYIKIYILIIFLLIYILIIFRENINIFEKQLILIWISFDFITNINIYKNINN